MDVVLTFEHGEQSYPILPADLMRFERHFAVPWETIQSDPKMEHVLYLGWLSAKRTKRTDSEFEDWADTVTDVGGGAPSPLDQ